MDSSVLEKWTKVNLTATTKFNELPFSEKTQRALKECNFHTPTEIQRKSLRPIVRGLDLIAQAQTGSGKTLAYTLPMLELLHEWKIRSVDGPIALIIVPTRELAHQTVQMIQAVARYHPFTLLHVVGDKDKKSSQREWQSVGNANIIVSTPGRLIQHMEQNPHCRLERIQLVVLDETDRLMDDNFEDQIKLIMNSLPMQRQLLIFSATQVVKVDQLVGLQMSKAVQVSVHSETGVTPANLHQHYAVVTPQYKVATLYSFLLANNKKRILVFVSCQKQVRYFYELFRAMRLPMKLFELRGNMILSKRTRALNEFASACQTVTDAGITKTAMGAVLMGTSVLERGLDFPQVDWVVQFDCPHSSTEYIHRAGRTARLDNIGNSLLFVLPTETKFLRRLIKTYKIDIHRHRIPKKLSHHQKIHLQLLEDGKLRDLAQGAFLGHLNDYLDAGERQKINKSIPNSMLKLLAQGYGLGSVPVLPEKIAEVYGSSSDKQQPADSSTSSKFKLNQLVDSDDDGDGGEEDDDDEEGLKKEMESDKEMKADDEVVKKDDDAHMSLVEKIGSLLSELSNPLKSLQLPLNKQLTIPGRQLDVLSLPQAFPNTKWNFHLPSKEMEVDEDLHGDENMHDVEMGRDSSCNEDDDDGEEDLKARDEIDKKIRVIIFSAQRYHS